GPAAPSPANAHGATESARDAQTQHRSHHRRACGRAWAEARRIPAQPRSYWSRADLYRARHLLGHVERALLLQKLEEVAPDAADQGPAGHPGTGRKRRRGGHWRWSMRRLQDGEP